MTAYTDAAKCDLAKVITRNVRALMALRAIGTQREVAARILVSEGDLSAKLRNSQTWTVFDLQKLAKVFDVPAATLLAETTDTHSNHISGHVSGTVIQAGNTGPIHFGGA